MIYFILYACYFFLICVILWKGFFEDGGWNERNKHKKENTKADNKSEWIYSRHDDGKQDTTPSPINDSSFWISWLFSSTTLSAISRTKLNLFKPKSLWYWSRSDSSDWIRDWYGRNPNTHVEKESSLYSPLSNTILGIYP